LTSRFVVITGGPGSGKTSLVVYLGSLGYATVPEAAIQIIDELNRARGVPGQIEWRQRHPAEFQRLITRRQAALEAACTVAEGSVGFCDRGRPDAKAYAELIGFQLDSEVMSLVESQQYLRVFLLDTLSHFKVRSATGRTSDRERSMRIHDLLYEAYRSFGYSPTLVPELSITDRARFVLSELGEPS
jgi:predicted ATPase